MFINRVWFTKKDEAVYISHLDLQRVMNRALRRSSLPVWYTQGFNPHIYLTFALPLALGHESLCETMDFKSEEQIDIETAIRSLNMSLPKGVEVFNITQAGMDAKEICYARYLIRFENEIEKVKNAIDGYNALNEANVEKKGKKGAVRLVNLKEHLPNIDIMKITENVCMDIKLPAGNMLNLNPELLLDFLSVNYGINAAAAKVCRTQVLTKSLEEFA